MNGKQLAQAEKERAEARAKAQVEWLRAHGAWHWQWPDDQGRWNTRLPVVKRHKNAAKCNYTPLPGSANGRNKRKRRALTANSHRQKANDA